MALETKIEEYNWYCATIDIDPNSVDDYAEDSVVDYVEDSVDDYIDNSDE